ncbi:MAG: hypothetical protein PUC47_08935 [Oscillospiraceae bacterium]|nr:hypothetical protein [Oscillospiraceae bacterium]
MGRKGEVIFQGIQDGAAFFRLQTGERAKLPSFFSKLWFFPVKRQRKFPGKSLDIPIKKLYNKSNNSNKARTGTGSFRAGAESCWLVKSGAAEG